MICDCGQEMQEKTELMPYAYTGLSDFLVEMTIRSCAACGEEEHAVFKIAQLHRALGLY